MNDQIQTPLLMNLPVKTQCRNYSNVPGILHQFDAEIALRPFLRLYPNAEAPFIGVRLSPTTVFVGCNFSSPLRGSRDVI